MTESIDRRFDRVAEGYARYRPTCPAGLVSSLAAACDRRERAWEPGCGSGQVTVVLAPHFESTLATDPAPAAIDRAPQIEGVRFEVGDASSVSLPDTSVDLIASGQAAHWFDMEAFACEARRVGRPEAIVAVWCYDRPRVLPAVDACVDRLYFDVLGGMWDAGRQHIDARYAALAFPFEEVHIEVPAYAAEWTAEEMLGYLGTWSAVDTFKQRGGGDAVSLVASELRLAWGAGVRRVTWPVGMRAGRVHG